MVKKYTRKEWKALEQGIRESRANLDWVIKKNGQNEFPQGSYAGYPSDENGVTHFPANIYAVNILDKIYPHSVSEGATRSLILVWKNNAGLQSKEIVKKKVVGARYIPNSTSLRSYCPQEIVELFKDYDYILERGDFRIKEFRDTPRDVFISYGVADPWHNVLNETLDKFRISKKEMGLEDKVQPQTRKVEGGVNKPLQISEGGEK